MVGRSSGRLLSPTKVFTPAASMPCRHGPLNKPLIWGVTIDDGSKAEPGGVPHSVAAASEFWVISALHWD